MQNRKVWIAAAGLAAASMQSAQAAEPQLVTLTQVSCQFVESENGVDHGIKSTGKSDCDAFNKETGDDRLAKAKVMELKPGKTIFRVTNANVDYGLGFYVRGDGLVNRGLLPTVSGGGLEKGVTKDYEIDLKPGEYVYSCPLNPTLDYKLIVKG